MRHILELIEDFAEVYGPSVVAWIIVCCVPPLLIAAVILRIKDARGFHKRKRLIYDKAKGRYEYET